MSSEPVEVPSFYANIFIAGDITVAKEVCREFCERGCCVTVTPTTFIYTYGEECGVVVGFINYARFPAEDSAVYAQACELGQLLMLRLHQKTFTVQTPAKSVRHSREVSP